MFVEYDSNELILAVLQEAWLAGVPVCEQLGSPVDLGFRAT